jgi:hypothetical protein
MIVIYCEDLNQIFCNSHWGHLIFCLGIS